MNPRTMEIGNRTIVFWDGPCALLASHGQRTCEVCSQPLASFAVDSFSTLDQYDGDNAVMFRQSKHYDADGNMHYGNKYHYVCSEELCVYAMVQKLGLNASK